MFNAFSPLLLLMQFSALDDECLWAVHLSGRFLPLGPRTIFPCETPSGHNYCQSAFAGTGTGTGVVIGTGTGMGTGTGTGIFIIDTIVIIIITTIIIVITAIVSGDWQCYHSSFFLLLCP